jgi:hypothetical protein
MKSWWIHSKLSPKIQSFLFKGEREGGRGGGEKGKEGERGRYNYHRYLREVDCSSLQKIHFNKIRALVAGTNKAGGLTRQAGWVNRCACFNCQ